MEKSAKINKKEAKDEKLRDQKIEEQVNKCLEVASTPEEKLQLLLAKHIETEKNNKKINQQIKMQEKQLETVLREKENLQREHNKSVLMCDKLQEVCREQQKLIKSVKNESMQKIRDEEERRKESTTKFQSSLNDITLSLKKNNEENIKLRDHNIEMTKKLKFLAEQYQLRELQLEKLNEQVQLETQLHQAKLAKVTAESMMEKDMLKKEKQIVEEKLQQTQKIVQVQAEREIALKEKLDIYTSKYDDFHNSLQKSNDMFTTYKLEMEKMTKKTRKLEKEALEWKRRFEKSNATLIELATEKKERDDHVMRCNKQVEQLQKLLRALQSERTHLYKSLRENKIEVPPMPVLPPEPEPIKPLIVQTNKSSDSAKMDLMTKNCAELKETLANLQSQMKNLNLQSNATPEAKAEALAKAAQDDVHKKRKNKKQKSKQNKNNANANANAVNGEETIANGKEINENNKNGIQTAVQDAVPNENGTKGIDSEHDQQAAEPAIESEEKQASPLEKSSAVNVEANAYEVNATKNMCQQITDSVEQSAEQSTPSPVAPTNTLIEPQVN